MPKVLSEKERREREKLIMDRAMELFDCSGFSELTMSGLAKACGMAKGTLFLYFPTKETLFARLMYREYREWGRHERRELQKQETFTRESYREFILAQTRYLLLHRMRMIRLVSMKRTIINKNIAPEILAEEIRGLDETIRGLSGLTARKLDFLTEENIYNLYMARHVIVIGAYNLATGSDNIRKLKALNERERSGKELAVIPTEETVLKMTEEYLKLYCG